MEVEIVQRTGCHLEAPDERDFDYELIAGGQSELPERFRVQTKQILNQGSIDACVGFAVATSKSVQEGKELSPRFLWSLAKAQQSYVGWGTYISYALKALVNDGDVLYGEVSEDVTMDRDSYMRLNVTPELRSKAAPNKAQSYWRVRAWNTHKDIEAVKQALYEEKHPLITSMRWYSPYNNPIKGFLPQPSGNGLGHCFVLVGWDTDQHGREYLIFQNSWSEHWGDNGHFYIHTDELEEYGLGSFYAITDIPLDKGKILSKYAGKIIKNTNSPKVYYVNGKQIAWIKNEPSFHFGTDSGFWGTFADVLDVEEPITEDIIF